MNKYPSSIAIMVFICCIFTGMFLAYAAERYDRNFSSPSSEAGPLVGPGFLIDPNDIMYWPSIDELVVWEAK